MEKIFLHNTLTRKKEEFKPISKGHVGIYSCGPTVYWYQHIGNIRSYIFSDILKRTLLYNKLKVKHVINITDVGHLTSDSDEGEDKMELAAKKESKNAKEISKYYFNHFSGELKKANIIQPTIWSKATEHIKEQINLIKELEKKGFTYRTLDGIYFDTSKIKDYGKLARLNIKGLKAGKRIKIGEKKNKTDFALWKFSSEKRQQEWDSPWGIGFPGWHIECSAMSIKYLGKTFDIHTGGEDHIPIHHTNEIAQSESATGKKFVNYWLHGAFLRFKGEKVSKSKGGSYTLSELEEKGYPPMAFRYLCLQTHYRKPLEFSLEAMDSAKNAYERIKRKIINLRKEKHKGNNLSESYEKNFLKAINDDLNVPKALSVFLKALEDFNFSPKKRLDLLEKFDNVLGIGIKDMKEKKLKIPAEIIELVEEREKLRKAEMWADADMFRERILEKGYLVEDTEKGPRIYKSQKPI